MTDRYIEMGGMYNIKGDNFFGRKIYIQPTEIADVRKKFNNTDVYATVFSYDADNQNESNLFGPLYLDLDYDIKEESDYSILKRDLAIIVTYLNDYYGIPESYIKFYFTGKKGFHLIIPAQVFGVVPDNNLNIYYKEIAKELNKVTLTKLIDTKIYDKKRLLRLPNSINAKTGLYKVPITYNDIMKYSFSEIKDYASCPKSNIIVNVNTCNKAINEFKRIKDTINAPKNKTTYKHLEVVDIDKVKLPQCILNILKEGAKEGNRNHSTIILASAFFQNGASFEDTWNAIMEWNEKINNPSLPQNEINVTVKSAYQQVQSGKRYGCTAIKELDLCVGRACKIHK